MPFYRNEMSRCKECLIQRQPQPVSQPFLSRTVNIGSILPDWHVSSLEFSSTGVKVESHSEFKISPGVHPKIRSIFKWFREEMGHRIKVVWQFFKWENERDIQTWLNYTSLFSTIVGHKSTPNFLLVVSLSQLNLYASANVRMHTIPGWSRFSTFSIPGHRLL